MAVVVETEDALGAEKSRPLSVGLMLVIAYGCSLGGIATLVGTPPNMVFVGIFEEAFPEAEAIGFGQWMLLGVPLSAIMLAVAWAMLTKVLFRCPPELRLSDDLVEREFEKLGGCRFAEKLVMAVFAATALLWVFRSDLNVGLFVVPGWGDLVPYTDFVDEGTVAIAMALMLFLIPSRATHEGESRTVLSPDVFGRIPWY